MHCPGVPPSPFQGSRLPLTPATLCSPSTLAALPFVSHCPRCSQLQGPSVSAHLCGCGHSPGPSRRCLAVAPLSQIDSGAATPGCAAPAQLQHIGCRGAIAVSPTGCSWGLLSPTSQPTAVAGQEQEPSPSAPFRDSWGYKGSRACPGS